MWTGVKVGRVKNAASRAVGHIVFRDTHTQVHTLLFGEKGAHSFSSLVS